MQLSKRHLVDKTLTKSIKIEHYLCRLFGTPPMLSILDPFHLSMYVDCNTHFCSCKRLRDLWLRNRHGNSWCIEPWSIWPLLQTFRTFCNRNWLHFSKQFQHWPKLRRLFRRLLRTTMRNLDAPTCPHHSSRVWLDHQLDHHLSSDKKDKSSNLLFP